MERREKNCMLCVDVGVWESKNHNSGFWKMMIMVFVLKMKKGDLKGKKRRGSFNLGRRSFFRTNPFYWEKERVISGCSNHDVVSFSNSPKTFLTTITTNKDVAEFFFTLICHTFLMWGGSIFISLYFPLFHHGRVASSQWWAMILLQNLAPPFPSSSSLLLLFYYFILIFLIDQERY